MELYLLGITPQTMNSFSVQNYEKGAPYSQVGTTPYDPLYLKSIQTQRNLFSQEQTGPRKKFISQNLRKLFWPLTRVIMGRSSIFLMF